MTSQEINKLPDLLEKGLLNPKEAMAQIIIFINTNYPIFGLHKYDEDFRSEIILQILERGEKFILLFDPVYADFFTYLYCYILSLIHTRRKAMAKQSLRENLTVSEGINIISDISHKYQVINYDNFEKPKIPYSFKPINPEDLKRVFAPISDINHDKKILVLALKSCFYITDEMVLQISKMYDISTEDLYKTIQYCKETVLHKSETHSKAIERRNFAYYHHKKYDFELCRMKNYELEYNNNKEPNQIFLRKYAKHLKSWNNLNNKFEKGFLYLRPKSKTIAEILGISERLVSYYISRAKYEMNK